MQITIKQHIGGKWQDKAIDIAELDGYRGTDTVAILAEGMIWCGSDKWYRKYEADERYPIVTNSADSLELLKMAQSIFLENREHRLAYMTQDGDVTDEQAHKHMDTLPEIYGTQQEFIYPEDF